MAPPSSHKHLQSLSIRHSRARGHHHRGAHTTFLSLPVELRLQIYRHLLAAADVREPFASHLGRYEAPWRALYAFPTALLRVCRSVSAEYKSVAYGENTWYFHLRYGWNYLGRRHRPYQKLPCRDHVRRIVVHFHAGWPLYYRLGGTGKLMVGRDEGMAVHDCREVLRALRRFPLSWVGVACSEGEAWEEGPGLRRMVRFLAELRGEGTRFVVLRDGRGPLDEDGGCEGVVEREEGYRSMVEEVVRAKVLAVNRERHWSV